MTEPSERLPVIETIQVHEEARQINHHSRQAKTIEQTEDRQSNGDLEAL